MLNISSLTNKKNVFLLICILLFFAILIRSTFFIGGVRGSDAYAYALYAHQIETGQYNPDAIDDHFGFRYIVLITTAISYYLFGVNDVSSSIFTFLFSLLNIVVIFFIAKIIFDIEIAILSSILLITYPLDTILASFLGPDSFTPLLSSLTVFFYLIADEEDLHSWHYNISYLLSGLVIGFAISARETSIFLLAVLLLHQFINKRTLYPCLWILLGLSIPLMAEAAFYYIKTGDPILRIHKLDYLKALVMADYSDTAGSFFYYPKMMFGYYLQGLATYGVVWWLVSAGLVWALMKKDRKIYLPAIWLILPFIGFEFGLQNIREMTPIMKNWNYLALITPPAMLISAYFLKECTSSFAINSNKKNFILMMIIVTLSSMNIYGIYRLKSNIENDAAPYIAASNYLRTKSDRVIYTHHQRWPLFLNYYFHYDPSIDFRTLDSLDDQNIKRISNAYIIMHKRYLEADVIGRPLKHAPLYSTYIHSPPPEWIKVFSFNGKPDYNKVTIYYAK